MGNKFNKQELDIILQKNEEKPENISIECHFELHEESDEKSKNKDDDSNDSFDFEDDEITLSSPNSIVKDLNMYPYNCVGTLTVKFSNEEFQYTCFLISENSVVTLASNLINKTGQKAEYIMTTFSNEEIKWENIFIQKEEQNSEKQNSKLAIIFYSKSISKEWLGVKIKDKVNSYNYIETIISNGNKINEFSNEKNEDKNNFKDNEIKNKLSLIYLKLVIENNIFKNLKSNEEKIISKRAPGSPLYCFDFYSEIGRYVFGIIDEFFDFHVFDLKDITFLVNMINKRKLLLEPNHKNINENNIINLDLSKRKLDICSIKYLSEYNLNNLYLLDLSENKLNSKSAFYLSQCKFYNLKHLNLNKNEIKDEGLIHIANGQFQKLQYLHLSSNKISHKGIKGLVKTHFIDNLETLSLSNNSKITDLGVSYIKDIRWPKLKTLVLSNTRLTIQSLVYLDKGIESLPKLRSLYISSNNFIEDGCKLYINSLRLNYIKVYTKKDYKYNGEKEDEDEIIDVCDCDGSCECYLYRNEIYNEK